MGKKDNKNTTVDKFKIIVVTLVNHDKAYHGKTLRGNAAIPWLMC